MTVIKRDRQGTAYDLVEAIGKLTPLLMDQGEKDAVDDLKDAAQALRNSKPGTPEQKAAAAKIVDAFEGDHELMPYTHQRQDSTAWTEADQLSQASARVYNLALRLNK